MNNIPSLSNMFRISMATTLLLSVAMVGARDQKPDMNMPRRSKDRNQWRRSEKPNIVFIITDDQDSELGSMNFMPKTLRLLGDEGAHLHNAFVTTPMCCPSRSSMLTGLYVHNHNVYTNNANCSSLYWQQEFEVRNFGTYLTNAGYRTGFFGKYLNEYQGTYIPPGWTEWVGLIRNTRYYNYTLNFNGEHIKHYGDYHKDYLTDLIANDSVTFLKQSKQYFPNRPVAMVLSMPAPHGPEDAAPQHQNSFFNVTTHRTPSWNFAPNADKQWLLQHTGKMEPIHIAFTDLLQTKRLQTLQAVDDAVEKVYNELKALGELENTYIIFTSDHGYHLGQYGLIKGKALPYDFDIRVPFYMRGPKVPQGVRVPNIALNIDLAPTFLDMAGVEVPAHMDGRSLLRLFDDDLSFETGNNVKRKKAWRDTFLVERGKVTQKKIKERARIEANNNPQQQLHTKYQRLESNCQKAEYQPPCSPTQEWECKRKSDGTLRLYKCRGEGVYQLHNQDSIVTQQCDCSMTPQSLSRIEKRRQKQFLSDHVLQPDLFKPKFLHSRLRREVDQQMRRRLRRPRRTSDFTNQGSGAAVCKVLADETVVCSRSVYADRRRWRKQRKQVDDTIADLRDKLDTLRGIKEHLQDVRPEESSSGDNSSDNIPYIQETIPLDDSPIGFHSNDDEREATLPSDPFGHGQLHDNLDQSPPSRQNDQPRYRPVSQSVDGGLENEGDLIGRRRKNRKSHKLDDANVETLPEGNSSNIENEFNQADYDEDIFEEDSWVDDEFHPEDYEDVDEAAYTQQCLCKDGQLLSENDVIKQQREERRQQRKAEIQVKKAEKKAEREQNREDKRHHRPDREEEINPTRDCQSGAMKCFEHSNDHWKTAPLWNKGPFCFCPNSNNNTYWCVRTINETHNFLYCEFITGFINYFDLTRDPYQLRNAVRDLSYSQLHNLHNILAKLKPCSGARQCTIRTRPADDTEGESRGTVEEDDLRL